jgi:hypothetical protein
MGTGSFQGVKQPGHGIDHPPSSSAKVKERVELYLCSPYGPSWPLLGWTLPLLYYYYYYYYYYYCCYYDKSSCVDLEYVTWLSRIFAAFKPRYSPLCHKSLCDSYQMQCMFIICWIYCWKFSAQKCVHTILIIPSLEYVIANGNA